MRKLIFIIPLFLFVFKSQGQSVSASYGNSRPIPSDFWGVAGQNTIRDNISWRTPGLVKKLPELHPMLIRYPGGDQGNWWDWKEGWFVESPYFPKDYNKVTKGPDKPEDMKPVLDEMGAKPIWILNMLTATLQDQLQMLRHVKQLGMSIEYVELGSEFYLEGNPLVLEKFPTAGDYAREANRWQDSIHKFFPETKCAYIGCFTKGNKPNRRNTWNEGVAAAMKNPGAITFHIYPPQSRGNATAEQKGDPIEILSEPFRAMDQVERKDIKAYSAVPEIWITEYNMNNNTAPVQGTWMHGIWAVLMSMKFLEEPAITHSIYYAMCGKAGYGAIFTTNKGFGIGGAGEFVAPANPPATTPFSFSATGSTLSIFGEVLKNKNSAAPIQFDRVPKQQCGTDGYSYPSLYGWKFSGSGQSEMILLNLSANEITLETGKLCTSACRYHQEYAAAYTYIAKGNEMSKSDGSVEKTMVLKPYSMTRIVQK